VLIDTTLGDVPSAPALEFAAPSAAPVAVDAVHTVSADTMRRAGKRSKVGLVVAVVALLGAGGGAWWWLSRAKSVEGGKVARTVEPVEGNLLASGYSFEGNAADWEADAAAPAAFNIEAGSRRSGDSGLGALLANEEWALARSGAVRPASARTLTARAWLQVEGAVDARLGVEFEATSGASARSIAWGKALSASNGFELVELTLAVPPGFDAARVVVLARSNAADGGTVDVDDVALCPGGEAQGAEVLDEFQLARIGSPATGAALFKIDRTLFSDLHVRRGDGARSERAEIRLEKRDLGFELGLDSGAGRTLSLRVDEPLLKGGVATTGAGGYRSHAGEFTREGATSLIVGTGKDLVRLRWNEPALLRARPEDGGLRVDIPFATETVALVQLVFRTERDEAQTLARDARDAEKRNELGVSAAAWGKLRDEFPFDPALLAEAEATRARLAERGLAEVRVLRKEVERARFFRLVDLFRRCRHNAESIAARFKGSEVEAGARELVTEIQTDLGTLEADLDRVERARLDSIARSLEATHSTQLAQRVRSYLESHLTPAAGANNGVR
jgi:hypothetical protein